VGDTITLVDVPEGTWTLEAVDDQNRRWQKEVTLKAGQPLYLNEWFQEVGKTGRDDGEDPPQ
jgi:hypothetical protein